MDRALQFVRLCCLSLEKMNTGNVRSRYLALKSDANEKKENNLNTFKINFVCLGIRVKQQGVASK